MFRTVEVPLWLLVLIVLFAGVTFASHFLFPSVRWFFRRRAERLVARLNARLRRPIEPFKLARRYDMIQRLIYDPDVAEAVVDHARRNGVPENVAFERARDYAREIVPSFSATLYFTIGIRIARWLSRSLYRIRLRERDRARLDRLDPDAAVVFVINHRSNMDYVLVTWLVAETSALSYAVGEWARVWPLSSLVRAMGAYFIRRKDRGHLYRRVLARYVQLSVEGGVTQAFFPEGGLSLDGAVGPPKLGLFSYILGEEVDGPPRRDVIFVPVALNYDRVLEDRFLIAADKAGVRRFRPPPGTLIAGLSRHLWKRLTFRFKGHGTAAVALGEPLSLRAFRPHGPGTPAEALADELMARLRDVVPLVPVPLVALALVEEGPLDLAGIEAGIADRLAALGGRGVEAPARTAGDLARDGLASLARRRLVVEEAGRWRPVAEAEPVLAYYARSISHHFAVAPAIAATAKQ